MEQKIVRVNTLVSEVVECDAKDYWNMLVNNWEDFLSWLTAGGQELPTIVSTTLAPGSRRGEFPRTRIVRFDLNKAAPGTPEYLHETMIYANPETMTMFYRVDGVSSRGSRNYLAVQELDEVEPGKTKITIRSRQDSFADQAEAAKKSAEGYHHLIINAGAQSCRAMAAEAAKKTGKKA